jgi:hypothetical protein
MEPTNRTSFSSVAAACVALIFLLAITGPTSTNKVMTAELALQKPQQALNRTLVLYVHHERDAHYKKNLEFFMKVGGER